MKSFFNLFTNNVGACVILAIIFFASAIICGVFTTTDYDSLTATADDGVIASDSRERGTRHERREPHSGGRYSRNLSRNAASFS